MKRISYLPFFLFSRNTPASVLLWAAILLCACTTSENKSTADEAVKETAVSCVQVPLRFGNNTGDPGVFVFNDDPSLSEMVLIPGGNFQMGGDNKQAYPDEFPKHEVGIDSFYMDVTEVTNAQFQKFVDATGYSTTAERKPDWSEIQKSLPPGTPKPDDALLVPASLVFKPTEAPVNLNDYSQWWNWVSGANWKHPEGPGSDIKGKENYPVVHISWYDAMAYCKWAGKRLPTEAEWEFAARGGLINNIYPWGNEHVNEGTSKTNSWEGSFPYKNENKDGAYKLAPVKSYICNPYGLFDMSGNVWEWTSTADAKLSEYSGETLDKRVVMGGAFNVSANLITSVSRMSVYAKSRLFNVGFRCAK